MSRLYIHSKDYSKRITVHTRGAKVQRTLNGRDNLSFTVYSETKLDPDITSLGARVAIDIGNGYRTEYYLRELPVIELTASDLWKYTFRFDAPIYQLNDKIFNIVGEREVAHAGTAEEFLDLIITALGGSFYKKGVVDSTERKVLRFDNVNCLYALNFICDEFDLEHELVYEKVGGVYQGTINLKAQIGNDTAVTLDYFKGKAIKQIKRNNAGTDKIITRLFYKGSTRNLPQGYSGTRLNGSSEYLESNIAQYGEKEESKNFDDIMPERVGTVSSFSIDAETGDHLLVDASFPFDLWAKDEDGNTIYMIPQTTPKITFNSGDCSGLTFEVSDYDHSIKTMKLIPWSDEQGNETPNATAKPVAGDAYKLTDIWLPSAYVADAVSRLDAAAQAYLDDHCRDKAVYDITLNPIWQSENSLGLNIGDRFSLASGYFDMHSGSRVIEMEFNPFDGRIDKIKATDVKFAVQERKQAMMMKSLEAAVENNNLKSAEVVQKAKKTTNEVRMQVFDFKDQKIIPHKNKHEGLDPHYMAYDTREVQFSLKDVGIRPNYNSDNTKVSVSDGKFVHHSWFSKTRPEIDKLTNKYEDYEPQRELSITASVQTLSTTTTGYYCYAKIPVDESIISADIVFDTAHIPVKRDIELGYIYYKIGYIGKVINGKRTAHLLWGYDEGVQESSQNLWSEDHDGIHYSDGCVGIGGDSDSNFHLKVYGDAQLETLYATSEVSITASSPYLTMNKNDSSQGYINLKSGFAHKWVLMHASYNHDFIIYGQGGLVENLRLSQSTGAIRFNNAYSFPTADGSDGQAFVTNGSGSISFSNVVTQIAAGNGMSFSTITGTGSVTLGTPSNITNTSTNSVTSGSHSHAIDAAIKSKWTIDGYGIHNNSGNVGIGGDSVSQYKLDVNGQTYISNNSLTYPTLTLYQSASGAKVLSAFGRTLLNGNVGINANPDSSHSLYLSGNSYFAGNVGINADVASDSFLNIYRNSISKHGIKVTDNDSNFDYALIYSETSGASPAGHFKAGNTSFASLYAEQNAVTDTAFLCYGQAQVNGDLFVHAKIGDSNIPNLQVQGDITGTNINAGAFKISEIQNAPTSAGATGEEGEIRIASNYIYICVGTNTWKRAALSTW